MLPAADQFSDLSIVIQGPVIHSGSARMADKSTGECIERLGHLFPKAEIIFSTWQDQDTRLIKADEVVLSRDPGGAHMLVPRGPAAVNINRQIKSSRAGLEKATRTYTLRLRSDLYLRDARFVSYWSQFPRRDATRSVFRERLLIYQFFTRNPDYKTRFGVPFHPGDWFHFGLSEDVRKLYSVPLIADEQAFSNLFPERTDFTWTMAPEQYLWLECLRQSGHPIQYTWGEPSWAEQTTESMLWLVNNFVVLGLSELSLSNIKFGAFEYLRTEYDLPSIMTHVDWLKMYGRVFGDKQSIPHLDEYRAKMNLVQGVKWILTKLGVLGLLRATKQGLK